MPKPEDSQKGKAPFYLGEEFQHRPGYCPVKAAEVPWKGSETGHLGRLFPKPGPGLQARRCRVVTQP